MEFRNKFGEDIFNLKYRNPEGGCGTWAELANTLVDRVCGKYLGAEYLDYAKYIIRRFKFIPAGRYLYYAGRPARYFNNCFSMIAEDSREGWADLAHNHMMALMVGGGVGTYYGKIREKNSVVTKTGGIASGPVPLMSAMNEIGRNVMQGGSRRSALYASLPEWHPDIDEFMGAKIWSDDIKKAKEADFMAPAPFDCTNMSVVYDSPEYNKDVFKRNLRLAMETGEPGFQFDLVAPEEVGRNACTEFISAYDSDMCNLGSINMAQIKDKYEMYDVAFVASLFLACGSLESELPYQKCEDVRTAHRKVGLGLMGLHEFLLINGEDYAPNEKLFNYMEEYRRGNQAALWYFAGMRGIPEFERGRSVAPSGTISLLAGTTSGIEPLFATSMKRRFFDKGTWKYQYIVDPVAKVLHTKGIDVTKVETSMDLAKDLRKRLEMQAYIQRYVDMGISSTINLPAWGTVWNNGSLVDKYARILEEYMHALRGVTFYPDGSRGGQPLTKCDWDEALKKEGETYEENKSVLEKAGCKGGVCGI